MRTCTLKEILLCSYLLPIQCIFCAIIFFSCYPYQQGDITNIVGASSLQSLIFVIYLIFLKRKNSLISCGNGSVIYLITLLIILFNIINLISIDFNKDIDGGIIFFIIDCLLTPSSTFGIMILMLKESNRLR